MDGLKNNSNKGGDLAVKLKTLRVEYNLTQADVAQKLGISQQTYSKYESKDAVISSDVIKKLCTLYGVSADYLLDLNTPADKDKDIDAIVNKVISKLSLNKEKL